MSNLSTFWVVAKLVDGIVEIEHQAYTDKKHAEARLTHLAIHDHILGSVWPVSAPAQRILVKETPAPVYIQGVVTTGRGAELHDYGGPSRPLVQVVSDAWLSWRQQQARLGNLDEAGQAPPDNLEELLEEPEPGVKPTQLRLPGL